MFIRLVGQRAIRIGLGMLVAGACLWLLGRSVHLDSFMHALRSIEPPWVWAALLAFGAGYGCRIERWRQMLKHENPGLRWLQCAGPFFAGYATNNLLPLRAGDVLRALAFTRVLGATSGAVVASLFVERLLDLLLVIVLLGAALACFGATGASLRAPGILVLGMAAGVIVLALLFPTAIGRVASALGGGIRRVSPKLGERVMHEISNGTTALVSLTSGHSVMRALFLSMVIWFCEGCVFWFAALAMPALDSAGASWLALPAGAVATLLPSTPGFVGTFEYAVVLAMTALGNSSSAAAAYAILVHGLFALPCLLLGGTYLLIHPHRPRADVAET